MEFVRRGAAGEWHNVPNKEIAIFVDKFDRGKTASCLGAPVVIAGCLYNFRWASCWEPATTFAVRWSEPLTQGLSVILGT